MSNSENDNGLYMILGEMRGDLKSIVSSQGTMRSDHRQLREDVEKIEVKHDTRITQLEKIRWKLAGIALLIPFGITVIGWYIRSVM